MSEKNILLVEDNVGDIELTKLTLGDCKTKTNLIVINDGQEAINYLLENNDLPDLIMLDIQLPSKNGFEILKELRTNAKLQDLKIVILTTGDSVDFLEEKYQVKPNGYLVKPLSIESLEKQLASLN